MSEDLVEKLLKAAVESKQPLSFEYQGLTRQVCPHMVGRAKDGRIVCHAYQYGGQSSKGAVTPDSGGWRFFYLAEIEGVADGYSLGWYPEDLKKSTAEYQPPSFIVEVLAVAD